MCSVYRVPGTMILLAQGSKKNPFLIYPGSTGNRTSSGFVKDTRALTVAAISVNLRDLHLFMVRIDIVLQ